VSLRYSLNPAQMGIGARKQVGISSRHGARRPTRVGHHLSMTRYRAVFLNYRKLKVEEVTISMIEHEENFQIPPKYQGVHAWCTLMRSSLKSSAWHGQWWYTSQKWPQLTKTCHQPHNTSTTGEGKDQTTPV
jgi:hypothetical protein